MVIIMIIVIIFNVIMIHLISNDEVPKMSFYEMMSVFAGFLVKWDVELYHIYSDRGVLLVVRLGRQSL